MFIDAKVFAGIIEKQTRMEVEMQRMKERIEVLEKRPVMLNIDTKEDDSSKAMAKMYHEMTDGVKDEKLGRVVYTDGRN